MCGIIGIIDLQSKARVDTAEILNMTNSIYHRGPDDEGYFFLTENEFEIFGGDDTPQEVFNSDHPFSPVAKLQEYSSTTCNLAFGHRRLSIIDPTPAGHQPFCSPDRKLWLVYNGEIYNYLELRKELEALGHQFYTNTDTEVLLNAYRQWDLDCLQHFNGMWAFVIYDDT
ncbi:MAG: asparagine synthetase B, partial [Bacteroidetes bacterium]|nr:asparagine synthetase B [Bacteroidota bacterium]